MNRLLLVLVAILTVCLVWQLRKPVPVPEILRVGPADSEGTVVEEALADSAPPDLDPEPMQAGIDDYTAMVERPLFVASRRPPADPAAVATGPVVPLEQDLRLTAVAISEQGRYALIRSKKDKKTYRLAAGQTLHGFQLTEINPGGVTLRAGDEVRSLPLSRERSRAEAPQVDNIKGLLEQLRARAQGAAAILPEETDVAAEQSEEADADPDIEAGVDADDPALQPTQELDADPLPAAGGNKRAEPEHQN